MVSIRAIRDYMVELIADAEHLGSIAVAEAACDEFEIFNGDEIPERVKDLADEIVGEHFRGIP